MRLSPLSGSNGTSKASGGAIRTCSKKHNYLKIQYISATLCIRYFLPFSDASFRPFSSVSCGTTVAACDEPQPIALVYFNGDIVIELKFAINNFIVVELNAEKFSFSLFYLTTI